MIYSFGTSFIVSSLLTRTVIPTSIDLHTWKEKEADREAFNMSVGHLNHNSSHLDLSVATSGRDALFLNMPVPKWRLLFNRNYLFALISGGFAYFQYD